MNVSEATVATPPNLAVLIKLLRPRQWTKNLIAFAPILFSGRMLDVDALLHTSMCVVALCLISGSVYVFNDIIDIEADRKHPTKCKRPLAANLVSERTAVFVACFALTISFLIAYVTRPALTLVLLGYLLLQAAYILRLKHRIILDVFCIATGFVLRALAGGAAAHVPLSAWFLLCTSLGALFLALEKRRQEIRSLGEQASGHRKVLGKYSIELLDRMEAAIVPSLITAYAFYSFQSQYGQWMMVTLPMVLYGILRYQVLSVRENNTGSPEEVLLKDRPIQYTIVLWLLACVSVVYGWLPKLAASLVHTIDTWRLPI
ncbi:decaprenyl-phosphate phosphoribosyltransferase [soil metagenome]